MHLGDVGFLRDRQGICSRPSRGERVSAAVVQVNARFGDGAIRYGVNQPAEFLAVLVRAEMWR